MSIESRIREQKEKIKQDQRELSRLQEEIRKKEEPRKLLASCGARTPGCLPHENIYSVRVCAESGGLPTFAEIERAIESLSDTPSEPKSYVDWNDPELDGFNWAILQPDPEGPCLMVFENRPRLDRKAYTTGWWFWTGKGGVAVYRSKFNAGPPWDKSLIHRPGAEE
jgi:hypothetical protein